MSTNAPQKTPKELAAEQKVALRSLSQSLAAQLFGIPTSWFRDQAHKVPRNDDGSYNASEIVKALRTDFVAAELSDASFERAATAIDLMPICDLGDVVVPGVIGVLEQIQRDYGAAGLAAVASLLLDFLKHWEKCHGKPSEAPLTPEEIRDKHNERAEAEIADLLNHGAVEEMRVVLRCEECGKRLAGRRWIEGPTPETYIDHWTICPECMER